MISSSNDFDRLTQKPLRYSRARYIGAEKDPVMVQRCLVEDGDLPHDHDFMEMQFVIAGNAQHWTIHGQTRAKRGDVFLLRPGAWHAYRDANRLEVWVCCFGDELLGREMEWMVHDPALGYLFWGGPLALTNNGSMKIQLNAAALKKCQTHIEALADLGAKKPQQTRVDKIGRLLLLFGELSRSMGAKHRAAVEQHQPPHRAVITAKQLIENDPQYNWTLHELARRVHTDKSYLVRLFKTHTGLAPMAYLARLRAEQAAGLLIRTNLSVGQIGQKVGWDDPNYFARRFKAHFGCSASQYRARWRNTTTSI